MSEKGIIFSAPMVRALLDGRKTQTRRLLTLRGHRKFSEFGPSDTPGYDWHFRRADACWCDFQASDLPLPYALGDRLYVREGWRTAKVSDELAARQLVGGGYSRVWYEADDRDNCDAHGRLRPSIHMPRWASRLTLTVTDVRVQRLQDISDADALAEGVYFDELGLTGGYIGLGGCNQEWSATPLIAFANLWRKLHTKPGERWEDNPWVVAVSFDVRHGNINELAA